MVTVAHDDGMKYRGDIGSARTLMLMLDEVCVVTTYMMAENRCMRYDDAGVAARSRVTDDWTVLSMLQNHECNAEVRRVWLTRAFNLLTSRDDAAGWFAQRQL